MSGFEDVTDCFFAMAEQMKPECYVCDDSMPLAEALLVPEFFTDNLDFSMFLPNALERVTAISNDFLDLVPEDEDLAIMLMCRDFQKILEGAKPVILFYHSSFALVLYALNRGDLAFIRRISEFQCVEAVFLMLKALTQMLIYYEAIQSNMEHGDDLQFEIFEVAGAVQSVAGSVSVDELCDCQIAKLKKVSGALRLPYFYYEVINYLENISLSDIKPLKSALAVIDAKFISEIAEYQNRAAYQQEHAAYYERYYRPENAILYVAYADGQISLSYEEMGLQDLATILAETKRELAEIIDNVQSYMNDSILGWLNNCLFAFHVNSGMLVERSVNALDQLYIGRKELYEHYSRYETQNIVVSNDIEQFQEPILVRIAFLTLLYCHKDFAQQHILSELLSTHCASAEAMIQAQRSDPDFAKTQACCTALANALYEHFLELVSAHAGRQDRIYRKFMQKKESLQDNIKAQAFCTSEAKKKMDSLVDFVFFEFGAVPYMISLLFSIIGDPKSITHAFYVLRQMTYCSHKCLLALMPVQDMNDNYLLLKNYLETRFVYCMQREAVPTSEDLNEYLTKFKAVRSVVDVLGTDVIQCAECLTADQLKCISCNPKSMGIFMCYSKYSKSRLALTAELWLDQACERQQNE